MCSTVVVREMRADDDASHVAFLDRLALSSPSVLAYHYPFYRDVLAGQGVGEALYLGAFSGDELVGVLPGFTKSSPVGTAYCSMPFFGPNAGVLCAEDGSTAAVHEALVGGVLARMAQRGDALSAVFYTPFLFHRFEIYDSVLAGAVVLEKFTNYLELGTFKLKNHIAWDVRKAARNQVTISDEITRDDVDELYGIYHENCLDYGIPVKPRGVVEAVVSASQRGEGARGYRAFREGRMIAGLICLTSPGTASYWLPCALHGERTFQPGTALLARAIDDARTRGQRYWNWEASPSRSSGVYRFKKKWGGAEGSYRIYVRPFKDREFFSRLGREAIARHFPYFFVYPFHELRDAKR